MSVSKWAYLPERCDGDVCVGDCDLCSKAQDNIALMEGDGDKMDDLIRRADAIDALERTDWYHQAPNGEMVHGANSVEHQAWYKEQDVYKALENVPTAQRWIPCSERLPPLFDETYLVCLAWGGVGTMVFKDTGFHNYGSFSPVPIETVTAWMPMPEPYREDGEQCAVN